MEDLVLLGSGGFAREVHWLIEENNKIKEEWRILGYISEEPVGTIIDGLPVLGNDDWILNRRSLIYLVCCIGDGILRKKIVSKFSNCSNVRFPNIIAANVNISDSIKWGKGCIVTCNNILTVDIEIGDFFICNLACTVGHGCKIGNYVTLNPGAHISGNVTLEDCVTIGTGANIIQGIHIKRQVMVGAGATVVGNIDEGMVVGGVPAKPLK